MIVLFAVDVVAVAAAVTVAAAVGAVVAVIFVAGTYEFNI